MTITVDIRPETQAYLLAMAEASGKSVQQYVVAMLESTVHPQSNLGPKERAAAWVGSAKRFPDSTPLSDEAISHESIYGERG